jgi:hypothetical protein
MADKKPVKVQAVTKISSLELDVLAKPDYHLASVAGQVSQEVVRKGREIGIEVFWDSIRTEQTKSAETGVITTRAYGYGYKNN